MVIVILGVSADSQPVIRAGYRAVTADESAAAGRSRPKAYAVDRSPRLRAVVMELLKVGWSPASIAGRLPYDYRDDQAVRVSHEAIYQWSTPSRCPPWRGS
jgi:transposase, IS30 family